MNIRVLLIILLYSPVCKAQEFAITNLRENVFYIGRPNEITVAANKLECKDIKVVPSYGEASPLDNPCSYSINIDRPGKILLKLYNRQNNELIGSQEYRVKYLPEPLCYIAGKMRGNIKLDVLNAQSGITAKHFYYIDFEDGFLVDHFSVSIVRDERVIFVKDVMGANFDDEVKTEFQKLQVGDVITFHEITGKGIDKIVRNLSAKEFTIVE